MRICYEPKRLSESSLEMVAKANVILAEYADQGFDLTLRQLYYQFVSRGYLANKDTEYKRLGSIISDARLAGLVDWDSIVDRTRNMRQNPHWSTPASIIESAAASYANDKWASQHNYVEVWIEKDALVGVISGVCEELDVPYFSCRGYTSQSEMWAAAMRLVNHNQQSGRGSGQSQRPHIIHLGDHDPSGIDMTRDIEDRLTLFCTHHGCPTPTIHRIALNWDQIEQYRPPPNPAKITDSRANGYIARFGDESWELDALEPAVLADLIREKVVELRDGLAWGLALEREERGKKLLSLISGNWPKVERMFA